MRKQAQKALLAANNRTDLLITVKRWYENNHSASEK
jgi:hypothetical protein